MNWILIAIAIFIFGFAFWFHQMGQHVIENDQTFKMMLIVFFACYIAGAFAVHYIGTMPEQPVSIQSIVSVLSPTEDGGF